MITILVSSSILFYYNVCNDDNGEDERPLFYQYLGWSSYSRYNVSSDIDYIKNMLNSSSNFTIKRITKDFRNLFYIDINYSGSPHNNSALYYFTTYLLIDYIEDTIEIFVEYQSPQPVMWGRYQRDNISFWNDHDHQRSVDKNMLENYFYPFKSGLEALINLPDPIYVDIFLI